MYACHVFTVFVGVVDIVLLQSSLFMSFLLLPSLLMSSLLLLYPLALSGFTFNYWCHSHGSKHCLQHSWSWSTRGSNDRSPKKLLAQKWASRKSKFCSDLGSHDWLVHPLGPWCRHGRPRHLPGGAENVQRAWFGVPSHPWVEKKGQGADCTESLKNLLQKRSAVTWWRLHSINHRTSAPQWWLLVWTSTDQDQHVHVILKKTYKSNKSATIPSHHIRVGSVLIHLGPDIPICLSSWPR